MEATREIRLMKEEKKHTSYERYPMFAELKEHHGLSYTKELQLPVPSLCML
jgi:hypothetical protein